MLYYQTPRPTLHQRNTYLSGDAEGIRHSHIQTTRTDLRGILVLSLATTAVQCATAGIPQQKTVEGYLKPLSR